MSFTLSRGRSPSPILRVLKTNLTIRSRLPVSGSSLYIKNSPFSSHAVLSRLPTPGSSNAGNIGVSRRPRCVDSVTNMHRQCMLGVRLNSTLDEAATEKKAVKQSSNQDEAPKAEDAEEETDEETDDEDFEEETEEEAQKDWNKDVPVETVKNYKNRFPRIHDITVKCKTGQKDKEDVFDEFFKAYVTLQGRKQNGRKPRVWVSFSEDMIPQEVAEMEWPTGKEGATKTTLCDWEENQHDLRVKWPVGKLMEFQVMEKVLVKGNRKIWREVVQKGGVIVDDEKGEEIRVA